jgi:CBS domain containing-hemolysin-like protein
MYNLLITYFLFAIAASFLCSLLEAVLLSITPAYARHKMLQGGPVGRRLDAFKSNIDRPLAAILTLNTIAHTVGAIGVGEQAVRIWADTNPMITGVIVPVSMVLSILILSEIIPKTLGATHWQKLVPFTVATINVIIFLLYPVVWVSQIIIRTMDKGRSQSVFSRSEFLAMAEIGVSEGAVEKHDREIIVNLLRMEKVQVKDIMTPRTVVRVASEEQTNRSFYESAGELPFSRILLYEGEVKEHISGYFLKAELLESLLQGNGDSKLGAIKRDIHVVHESLPISDIFDHFLGKREHIVLVVDEYGGMSGVVTMEDVMETLLGMEITDESDSTVDMQVLARKNWEKRARRFGLIGDSAQMPDTITKPPDDE